LSLVSCRRRGPLPRELEQIVQLAVILSSRLTRLHLDDPSSTIAEALDQIASVTRVDGCQLLEFSDSGTVARTHVPIGCMRPTDAAPRNQMPDAWLVERLARGELVTISQLDDLPREATEARVQARRTGACSVLGVPASVAGQVVCALVLDTGRLSRRPPLVERLQLLAEILGAGLRRGRDESALRANVAVIERLNARLEADNVCLKEEIKSYHDFDDIVGESAPLRTALSRLAQVAPMSSTVLWGLSTDIAVPGDYDGDGKIDPAIFRPSTGLWAILKSSTSYATSATVAWGLSTDVPVPGDYDGAPSSGTRRRPDARGRSPAALQEGNSSVSRTQWTPRSRHAPTWRRRRGDPADLYYRLSVIRFGCRL
jgi:hypothetical protein